MAASLSVPRSVLSRWLRGKGSYSDDLTEISEAYISAHEHDSSILHSRSAPAAHATPSIQQHHHRHQSNRHVSDDRPAHGMCKR